MDVTGRKMQTLVSSMLAVCLVQSMACTKGIDRSSSSLKGVTAETNAVTAGSGMSLWNISGLDRTGSETVLTDCWFEGSDEKPDHAAPLTPFHISKRFLLEEIAGKGSARLQLAIGKQPEERQALDLIESSDYELLKTAILSAAAKAKASGQEYDLPCTSPHASYWPQVAIKDQGIKKTCRLSVRNFIPDFYARRQAHFGCAWRDEHYIGTKRFDWQTGQRSPRIDVGPADGLLTDAFVLDQAKYLRCGLFQANGNTAGDSGMAHGRLFPQYNGWCGSWLVAGKRDPAVKTLQNFCGNVKGEFVDLAYYELVLDCKG